MKDYNIIITSVKNSLRFGHTKDYTMGYIYGLLDWHVISTKTFEELKDFINKEEKK